MFILKEKSNEPKVSLIVIEYFSCGNLPPKLLAHVHIVGLKRPIHITCEWLKTMRSRRLATVQRNGSRSRVKRSENIQVTGVTIPISPIHCSVRVIHEPYSSLNDDIPS